MTSFMYSPFARKLSAMSKISLLLIVTLFYSHGDGSRSCRSWRLPWSSTLFRVDPQNIIRLICKHGGIVLPKSIERDLNIIEAVCDCDKTYLDLYNRELVVQNFTVAKKMDGDGIADAHALRVGRFLLKWDSYLKPCVEIEVEDVDVLIDFVNLILSRNNWNELSDIGFPPLFYDADTDSPSLASTLVRIGSIKMDGEVRLKIRSKPLDENLVEDIVFDMLKLREMTKQIRAASQKSEEDTGRRGCTTEELYRIIQLYFGQQIQQFLKLVAFDIARATIDGTSESKSINDAKRVWSGAKDAAMKYVQNIGGKTEERIEESLKQFGLDKENLNLAMNMAGTFFGRRRTQGNRYEYHDIYVVEADDE